MIGASIAVQGLLVKYKILEQYLRHLITRLITIKRLGFCETFFLFYIFYRPESECANSELVKNTDDLLGSTTNTPSAAVNNNSETQQKPVSMSRLLTDEEIQKILTRSSDDASGNVGGNEICQIDGVWILG